MNKLFFLFISLISCLSFSCTKEADRNRLTSEATIGWRGDYALDGCGYVIEVEEKEYKPINEEIIDDSFKEKPTKVVIEYKFLDEEERKQCGLNPETLFDQIQLFSIRRR